MDTFWLLDLRSAPRSLAKHVHTMINTRVFFFLHFRGKRVQFCEVRGEGWLLNDLYPIHLYP